MTAILLHPSDNILVVTAAIAAGDIVSIDGDAVVIPVPVQVGHKIARLTLSLGETVIKYGAPIGSMTAPAARGDHVHLHNMKSDYIASHLRDTLERSTES
ncbi:UxaA family hydrolase [Sphingomonas sp. CARO-RG-8B-R24-01]|uniref:UxaA family hydrolase n=1 Tax=Sphingomonas sp. CARO-RG-8B-R24-01 TaxID=2914831 RepID=UPI001F58555F|nr:UxaA family hydrolase [Sphingomonas sp. CARO-RG-8B-R24-01]